MALDIPLRKANTEQHALTFLGPKIWTKISHSTNSVKTTAFFRNALKRKISNKLCR